MIGYRFSKLLSSRLLISALALVMYTLLKTWHFLEAKDGLILL